MPSKESNTFRSNLKCDLNYLIIISSLSLLPQGHENGSFIPYKKKLYKVLQENRAKND